MPYSNLAEVSLAAGDLAEARSAAKGARDSADLFPDRESRFYRVEARSLLASALFAQGHLRESLQEFRAAVRKQQEYAEASPSVERVLAGVRGFRLGELLFSLGGRPQSWDCSLQLIHTPGTAAEPLTSAFNRLSIGRIRHAASLRSGHTRDKAVSPVECVLPHFCAAISIIRACGRHAHLAQALLVRAYAYLHFGDRDEAYRDLKEALDLSTRIGLRLHEADSRLLEGHLALDLDPPDAKTATDSLKRADTLVQETGYHLRDADLLILEGRLLAKQGDKEAGQAKLEEAIHVAKREEKDGCVYQVAVDQAERYLREMGVGV
jgi:tetratricopeptide (TPR) repeat protein